MLYLNYYLISINVISFILYGIDKYKAKKRKSRISERTIFIITFLGGVIGSILGMFVFNHKLKKKYFYICDVLALFLWIYIIWMIINK